MYNYNYSNNFSDFLIDEDPFELYDYTKSITTDDTYNLSAEEELLSYDIFDNGYFDSYEYEADSLLLTNDITVYNEKAAPEIIHDESQTNSIGPQLPATLPLSDTNTSVQAVVENTKFVESDQEQSSITESVINQTEPTITLSNSHPYNQIGSHNIKKDSLSTTRKTPVLHEQINSVKQAATRSLPSNSNYYQNHPYLAESQYQQYLSIYSRMNTHAQDYSQNKLPGHRIPSQHFQMRQSKNPAPMVYAYPVNYNTPVNQNMIYQPVLIGNKTYYYTYYPQQYIASYRTNTNSYHVANHQAEKSINTSVPAIEINQEQHTQEVKKSEPNTESSNSTKKGSYSYMKNFRAPKSTSSWPKVDKHRASKQKSEDQNKAELSKEQIDRLSRLVTDFPDLILKEITRKYNLLYQDTVAFDDVLLAARDFKIPYRIKVRNTKK